jgi:hypothetical protein
VGVVVGGTSLKKRRSAAGAALIFIDERESLGLLEELSAVGAEPLVAAAASTSLGRVRIAECLYGQLTEGVRSKWVIAG